MQEVKENDDRHYIFGYGSLMCPQSRAISAPTLASKDAHPVLVQNLVRTWSTRVHHDESTHVAISTTTTISEEGEQENLLTSLIEGQTAMGVRKALNHNCSGVLIEVDSTELRQFDEREKEYDRVEIDLLHIWSLGADEEEGTRVHSVIEEANIKRSHHVQNIKNESTMNSLSSASTKLKVWVYVQRESIPANHQFPIAQSYVDIILRGCLTISPEFASKFLETTHGWWSDSDDIIPDDGASLDQSSHNWVEDRNNPFYVRADKEWSQKMAHFVDVYLDKHQPHALTKRRQIDMILKSFEKVRV